MSSERPRLADRTCTIVVALVLLLAGCSGGSSPTGPNTAPTLGEVSVSPLINENHVALMGATNLTFAVAGASDPDGDALTYSWNFGDGVTAQGATPTHRYNTPAPSPHA